MDDSRNDEFRDALDNAAQDFGSQIAAGIPATPADAHEQLPDDVAALVTDDVPDRVVRSVFAELPFDLPSQSEGPP